MAKNEIISVHCFNKGIGSVINFWMNKAVELELPNTIIKSIERDFNYLL